jgi:uncharacterized metal-binding protein YceD (DUF177 family)
VKFAPALVTVEAPFEIKETLSPEVLGLDAANAKVEKPVEVEIVITKDEENFLAQGWAVTKLSLLCGRCTSWMPWPIRARIDHLFEGPHPNSIELTPLVREDILLELPMNAVCRLAADGRCPVTGEIYHPPESSGVLSSAEVWSELSKLEVKPEKKARKPSGKRGAKGKE